MPYFDFFIGTSITHNPSTLYSIYFVFFIMKCPFEK